MYLLLYILPTTPASHRKQVEFTGQGWSVMSWQGELSAAGLCEYLGRRRGPNWTWNAGVHFYEAMWIMGCLHSGKRCERKIRHRTAARAHTNYEACTWFTQRKGDFSVHVEICSNTRTPSLKNTITQYKLDSTAQCSWWDVMWGKDEENELTVNWMLSGLVMLDNTSHCAVAAVEAHHQHNAL